MQQAFAVRRPWVTGFRLEGTIFGGNYIAADDARLRAFLDEFPNPGRVLELGCLEGGHTFPIAEVAREVVAIDARRENLAKAEWLNRSVFNRSNIRFVEANLEEFDFTPLGVFDVAFNVGLLYHLSAPSRLLARLARVAQTMFLWTHFAPKAASAEADGYRGIWYVEHGRADPLSGMQPASFWPTLPELQRMLADAGFADIHVHGIETAHPHGPAVLVSCRSSATWAGTAPAEITQAGDRTSAFGPNIFKKFCGRIGLWSDNHVGKLPTG
jgi:SAM-dependent methyltransferase